MATQAIDRAATQEEIAILRWMLEHAPVGDVSAYRNQNLDELRVVGRCDCGCASVFFESDESARYEMIADAIAKDFGKFQANLILWGRAGMVAWLEMWGPETICPLPPIKDMSPW